MTRKIILSIFAMVITFAIQAQTETKEPKQKDGSDQIQTLFKHKGPVGWWVAPEFSYTMIEEKNAYIGGISGGIIIDHNFSIGLAGSGIMTTNSLSFSGINDTADVYLYGGWGGLKLEYRINPLKPVNVAFPLLIGGGGAAYSTWGPNDWYNSNQQDPFNDAYIWDSYFVIEPGVVIGINLLKFMRLDAGISYKYVSGLNLMKTDKTMLNGFNANISLKFGRF
jgi:hypothetical protein